MATISTTHMAKSIYAAIGNKKGDELQAVLSNTVKTLSSNGLLSKSDAILEKLQDLIDEGENTIRATVYSVNTLESGLLKKIEQELKKRYNVEKVHIISIEDTKLLGGIKIEVHDEIIDLSIEKKVSQLKKHLLN